MLTEIEPVPLESTVDMPVVPGYRYIRMVYGERAGRQMIVGFWSYNAGDPEQPPNEGLTTSLMFGLTAP